MAKKIVISNQKGGVGKTTTAIMLAQELQGLSKKVLMIDMDGQQNATNFYQAQTGDGEATLGDIMYCDTPAIECIHHEEHGDIIPSDPNLKEAETQIKTDIKRFKHLKKACESIEDMYDYIIMDTPPAIGVLVLNAFMYADEVIIPISEDGWSINGVMDVIRNINDVREDGNPDLNISGFLIVNSTPHTRKSKRIEDLASELAEKVGTRLYKTKIRHSVRITEALTELYVPLYVHDSSCTSQLDYEDFVKEFLKYEREDAK